MGNKTFVEKVLDGDMTDTADWQIDDVVDLSPLQKSVLKRHLCRRESIEEIAAHLRIDPKKISHVYQTGLKRLQRLSKSGGLENKPRRAARPSCHECGAPLKSHSTEELCDFCVEEAVDDYLKFSKGSKGERSV